jgi:hypothetical protein
MYRDKSLVMVLYTDSWCTMKCIDLLFSPGTGGAFLCETEWDLGRSSSVRDLLAKWTTHKTIIFAAWDTT